MVVTIIVVVVAAVFVNKIAVVVFISGPVMVGIVVVVAVVAVFVKKTRSPSSGKVGFLMDCCHPATRKMVKMKGWGVNVQW